MESAVAEFPNNITMDLDEFLPSGIRLEIEPPDSMDYVNSPAPTVASSVDVHAAWNGGHDTSEYNSEYEEGNEVEGGEVEVYTSGANVRSGAHWKADGPQRREYIRRWS